MALMLLVPVVVQAKLFPAAVARKGQKVVLLWAAAVAARICQLRKLHRTYLSRTSESMSLSTVEPCYLPPGFAVEKRMEGVFTASQTLTQSSCISNLLSGIKHRPDQPELDLVEIRAK